MVKEKCAADSLAKTIAGEIVLSENPGNAIQKWRNIFKIPQRMLADKMDVMPSVISDYESGRRKSPGVKFIQRIVNSLIEVDRTNGCPTINEFNAPYSKEVLSDAVIDMQEYAEPVSVADFSAQLSGEIATDAGNPGGEVHGHVIIDSLKAVLELAPSDLLKLHDLTREKAMIFTNINSGKSAFVAIKVTNLKPEAVVFHSIREVDPLAIRIAHAENIPIIVSRMKTVDELIAALKSKNNTDKANSSGKGSL